MLTRLRELFSSLDRHGVEYLVIGGTRMSVVALEDLIASKAAAGRPRDLEDVEALTRRRGRQNDR